MTTRKAETPVRVYRRPENGFEAYFKGWPSRPNWLVDVLAPGIDFYNIAGFPTWREAFDYAHWTALRHNQSSEGRVQ